MEEQTGRGRLADADKDGGWRVHMQAFTHTDLQ